MATSGEASTTSLAHLFMFWGALVMSLLNPSNGFGITATHEEVKAADHWISQYFAIPASSSRAFSYICDGTALSQFMSTWSVSVTEEDSELKKVKKKLILEDPKTGLKCAYTGIFYRSHAAVELLLQVTNTGEVDSPLLEKILPLDCLMDLPGWPCTVHHMLGDWNSEQTFMPLADKLEPQNNKSLTIAPNGGRSSDEQMPFFNLQWAGGGVVMAIGWAGQWKATFECKEDQRLGIRAGQQLTRLRLHPGESIRTPRILLQFWQGKDEFRAYNLFRQWMLEHNLPRRNGELVLAPICGSVTETAPDGSYEEPHIRVMKPLAERGIEVFWSDMDPQQWYPIGFPDGTGTWEPDPAKYPRGLGPIGEAARAAGLEYLLWFEPERVAPGTRIEQLHPEWLIKRGNQSLFRLDLPEARAWLTDYIDVQITEAGLSWLRWDFNMRPLEYWRGNDAAEREGITEIRHVEGLYAMWDELMRRHPGLMVDICASGGRRIDFETMRYGLPLWHSDRQCFGPGPMADQLQNGGLFRWVPLHGCGVFGLEPSYLFRSGMTTGNILCVNAYSPENEEGVRKSVTLYKELRPFMLGDFYPLFPHITDESVWYGYQFHRPDLNSGFALLFRRKDAPYPEAELNLQGVDDTKRYRVTCEGTTEDVECTGVELHHFRVTIQDRESSMIIRYGPI